MIERVAGKLVKTLASEFKVVAITGPRQSGKTTLARFAFDDKPYASLEEPDVRVFAEADPRGFLAQFPHGAVLDEVQRVPGLLSYIQGIVDTRKQPGQFILTGSEHFGLVHHITQSLAGRAGFLRLLPFSAAELKQAGLLPGEIMELLFKGGYPPIYDQPVVPERWYNAYITTYIERDVRQLQNIRDLSLFQRFLALCAGNTGQLLNMARIGADCGINHETARIWLSVLEASYIIFRLQPHHRNFRKRLVKTPKLYFWDTGLASRLLGIETAHQLHTHPLRGALFENWVISEAYKQRGAQGKSDNFYFWRNNTGLEVDLLIDTGTSLHPIEIKSGTTIAQDWLGPLRQWLDLAGDAGAKPAIVYGGKECQTRKGVLIVPWTEMQRTIV